MGLPSSESGVFPVFNAFFFELNFSLFFRASHVAGDLLIASVSCGYQLILLRVPFSSIFFFGETPSGQFHRPSLFLLFLLALSGFLGTSPYPLLSLFISEWTFPLTYFLMQSVTHPLQKKLLISLRTFFYSLSLKTFVLAPTW